MIKLNILKRIKKTQIVTADEIQYVRQICMSYERYY